MAFKTFANGFPLPASDLNNFLMKQSVIVFADEAARTAALSSPTEGMVTYLEDDNELYKWTGASWVNIAAPSPVTTEGDLIIGDAGGAETRLPIGAAGKILTANGTTATWEDAAGGGGYELISSTAVTSGAGSQTITGITQDYKDLRVILRGYTGNSPNAAVYFVCRNGGSTISVSAKAFIFTGGSSFTVEEPYGHADMRNYAAGNTGDLIFEIKDYSSTTIPFSGYSIANPRRSSSDYSTVTHTIARATTAVNAILFESFFGSFNSGTIEIWGAK